MWVIAKFNKGEEEVFKKNLKASLGEDTKFYSPCFISNTASKKSKKFFIKKLLSSYIFCYNDKFSNIKIINSSKFTKGLSYFLQGYQLHQSQIQNFLNICKEHEDGGGYLRPTIFKSIIKDRGKFISGPFKNILFNILGKHKNKLEILLGDINVKISDRGTNFYQPV